MVNRLVQVKHNLIVLRLEYFLSGLVLTSFDTLIIYVISNISRWINAKAFSRKITISGRHYVIYCDAKSTAV